MSDKGARREDDDTLLSALRQAARDERAALEAWASGDIQQADARKRTHLASAPAARDLFAPRDSDALADRLLAQLTAAAPRAEKVAPSRRRLPMRAGLAAAGCTGLLAAAAVLLALRGPALPSYQFAVQGGDASARGPAADRVGRRELQEGSLLELRLWPERTLAQPVVGALFVRTKGRLIPSGVEPEIAASGALRWRGSARELTGARHGDVDLIAVVARAGQLPSASELGLGVPGQQRGFFVAEIQLAVSAE